MFVLFKHVNQSSFLFKWSFQGNPLHAKKLYVLAALEVERHRQQVMDETSHATSTAVTQFGTRRTNHSANRTTKVANQTAATLETLMTSMDTDSVNKKAMKVLDSAWRGAAAYHYFSLSLSQMYHGNLDDSLKTAIRLCEFEDVIHPKIIYSLIALCSFHTEFFSICSKAFVKLETMRDISEEERESFQALAISIFTKYSPEDPATLEVEYLDCLESGKPYKACTSSGRAVQDSSCVECKRCKYPILTHHVGGRITCPLCHDSLSPN